MTETLANGYSSDMIVLSKNYTMNTNMTGFKRFSKFVNSFAFDENSLSIDRVNDIYDDSSYLSEA